MAGMATVGLARAKHNRIVKIVDDFASVFTQKVSIPEIQGLFVQQDGVKLSGLPKQLPAGKITIRKFYDRADDPFHLQRRQINADPLAKAGTVGIIG
jgi:hypothetical protein